MRLFSRKPRVERHLVGECLLPQMRERVRRAEARRSIRSWKAYASDDENDPRRKRDYIPLDVISLRGSITPPSPKTIGRLFLCSVAIGLLVVRLVF